MPAASASCSKRFTCTVTADCTLNLQREVFLHPATNVIPTLGERERVLFAAHQPCPNSWLLRLSAAKLYCLCGGRIQLHWSIEVLKLRSKEKQIPSPYISGNVNSLSLSMQVPWVWPMTEVAKVIAMISDIASYRAYWFPVIPSPTSPWVWLRS